ncbi:Uncharacterized protein family UPF0546 [Musa troglodytarum]|uniref:Uncharacterized protein family UPF0546 n=1 Tax=Musa troglodytarum TaxID=320322 RepID=A0A9E7F5Q3_9LILI|nr:Uncharacterized protein family UPF0546 [Musa troglodytarum]
MAGDVEKMIAVGIVWGATNAVMRRGALVWDRKLQLRSRTPGHRPRGRLLGHVLRWIDLLLTWQYSVPFLINLSASAAFFHMLGGAPISVAVPVTNATTFAATAVAAMILGEEMRVGLTFFGLRSGDLWCRRLLLHQRDITSELVSSWPPCCRRTRTVSVGWAALALGSSYAMLATMMTSTKRQDGANGPARLQHHHHRHRRTSRTPASSASSCFGSLHSRSPSRP